MLPLYRFTTATIRAMLRGGRDYYLWVAFLLAWIALGAVAYLHQLGVGLFATNMVDQVPWGAYIANFTYLVGMAAAAVMLVIPAYVYHDHDLHEVVVLGELLAVAVLTMCLMFIMVDIGRPDRFWHLIPVIGRFNWPISILSWDVIALNGYLALNFYITTYLLYTKFQGKQPERKKYVPFVFLECGVSWAVQLLNDTIEHWEKRNGDAITHLDPARLDKDAFASLFGRYGGRLAELIETDPYEYVRRLPVHGSTPENIDEFAAMGVGSAEGIVEQFSRSFFFGCEGDDRGVVSAFAPSNRTELRALFSSDIGHWDVPDMARVVSESYAMVEAGYLSADEWRRVVFANPVEMYTRANPSFFDGTRVRVAPVTPPAGPPPPRRPGPPPH